MALVTKPDFNLIFASQAPSVDLPPQFNNYVRGMDETRKNNGKPTIKQFNYLHQNLDLKLLWILQNGGALPYDSSIEYAENSLALKDGELQQFVDGVWSPFKNAVNASDVKDEIGLSQQQINNSITSTVKSGLQGDNLTYDQTKYNLLLADSQEKGSPILVKDGVYRLEQGGNVAKHADELSPQQLTRKRYVDLRTGIYEPTTPPSWNPFQGWATENMDTLTYAQLVAKWDALAAQHPTRFFVGADLGTDQSGTYTLKQYAFEPKYAAGGFGGQNREIIVYAGLHGGELIGMLGLYYFIKDLLERGATDNSLVHIYNHVKIRICPCVNPWGMSQSPRTRTNSRGVDLNRNADFHWDEYPNNPPPSADYKGESAWSEAETQALKTWFDQYCSASFAVVDIHNFGATDITPAPHYTGYTCPLSYHIVGELASQLCRTGEIFNVQQLQRNPSPIHYAAKKFGLPALNPEHTDMAWGRSAFYDANRGTIESINGATRWYGNVILRVAHRFYQRMPVASVYSNTTRGGSSADRVISGSTDYVNAFPIKSVIHGVEGFIDVDFMCTVHNTSATDTMNVFLVPNIASTQLNEFEQYITVPPNTRAQISCGGMLYQPRSARNVAVTFQMKVLNAATQAAGSVTIKRAFMRHRTVTSSIESVSLQSM